MDARLYNKSVTCPVCKNNFEVTKVKSKGCKVASRDTDFCVYYEDINPIFYDVWVCEKCGYSAQSEKFEELSPRDAEVILKELTPRWTKRNFGGERTIDIALETFRLALYNLQLRKAKASETAKVCIRIAWLYRIKKDLRENDFLKFALKGYSETFERESFPVEKLDEFTCMYIIAELSRRVGNIDESIKWFSRLISSPGARKNNTLIEMARDQFHLVKEQAKKNEATHV